MDIIGQNDLMAVILKLRKFATNFRCKMLNLYLEDLGEHDWNTINTDLQIENLCEEIHSKDQGLNFEIHFQNFSFFF